MVKAEQRSRQLGVGLTPCKETLESEEGESCSSTEYSGAPSPLKQKQLSQTPQITKQSPKNIGGVKPISKNPINRNPTASSNVNKLQIIESVKEESPSKKVLRHYSAFDKENNDLGIEINIMTDTNVAVNCAEMPLKFTILSLSLNFELHSLTRQLIDLCRLRYRSKSIRWTKMIRSHRHKTTIRHRRTVLAVAVLPPSQRPP